MYKKHSEIKLIRKSQTYHVTIIITLQTKFQTTKINHVYKVKEISVGTMRHIGYCA